jgi:DNA-binding response OmpR family regulator
LLSCGRNAVNRTVLLVGPDLGFVFWLGRALDQAGYEAFPARDLAAAAETVSEFHLTPGLLILTASIPGSKELIADLKRLHEQVRVLCLAEAVGGNHVAADGVYPRPAAMTEAAKAELLKVISAVLVDNPVAADNSR